MEQGPEYAVIHIMSGCHAQSSATFIRKAWSIEKKCDSDTISNRNEIISELKSYVIGSIFSSVAFLEAYINELYCEAERGGEWGYELLGQNKELMHLMRTLWRHQIPRTASYPILTKYRLTLDLAEKPPLEKGTSPYQDVDYLIRLRNSLIHYEPEPIIYGDSRLIENNQKHKLEKQLKGRFNENPFMETEDPFYPDQCLSHGCAEWGLRSSLRFVENFMSNMGLKSFYIPSDSKYSTRG